MSNSARHRITPRRGRRIQAGAKVPATGSYIRQSAEGAADRNHSVALLGLPCGCILLQGLHPCLCSDTPTGLIATQCHSEGAKRRKNPTRYANEIPPVVGMTHGMASRVRVSEFDKQIPYPWCDNAGCRAGVNRESSNP